MSTIEQEIIDRIQKLAPAQKEQVLNFVRHLPPIGEDGRSFVARTHTIAFPKADLAEIARIIEEDAERIAWNDWNNPPEFPA